MDPLTSLVLTIAAAAVGFYVLHIVVRTAVLSALRAHHAEIHAPAPAAATHLDADGL